MKLLKSLINSFFNWIKNQKTRRLKTRLQEERLSAIADELELGKTESLRAFVFADALYNLFMSQHSLNFILSPEGKFILINPKVTDVLGWTMSDFYGKPFWDFVHEYDVDRTVDAWIETKENEGFPEVFTNRYLKKDGGVVFLEWIKTPTVKDSFIYTSANQIKNVGSLQ